MYHDFICYNKVPSHLDSNPHPESNEFGLISPTPYASVAQW